MVAEDQLRVEGGVALSELEGVLGHSFDREDVSTVGGLVLAEFGRVPRAGETIDLDGYRLIVEQVSGAGCGGSRCIGPPWRPARRRPSGCCRDLGGHRGRRHGGRVRRHGGRGADHGEPCGADPRGEPAAPRRGPVARVALPGRQLPHRGVGHDVARRPDRGRDAARRWRAPGAPRVVVALAILGVPLVLFAAYLVPRRLTQPRAETVADRVIPVLRPWSRVVGLLLPARTATRPTDLRSDLARGRGGRSSGRRRAVLVGGVMAFSVRPVREVMTPRTDIVAIDEHAALEDIRMVFAQSGYSRIPVYRGTLDDIIGMLHAFDLFSCSRVIRCRCVRWR